jgi:Raf kinase inhibitor-like YbhB/YbcL family protein
MRRFIPGMLAVAAISGAPLIVPLTPARAVDSTQQGAAAKLNVRTDTFADGATLPMSTVLNRFGCTGGNRSPHLAWSGEPSGTASFAVILHDADARAGAGWYHWVVFNIPPHVHELKEGAGAKGSSDLPAGAVLGVTDFGFNQYGGPCPPVGDRPHHYTFTVYALSSKINGGPATTGAALRFLMRTVTLATGTITGRYGR